MKQSPGKLIIKLQNILLLIIISKRYIKHMLLIFSSNPFYSQFVSLPDANTPLSCEIRNNNKFWPYFKNALGALDGGHFASSPPLYLRDAS